MCLSYPIHLFINQHGCNVLESNSQHLLLGEACTLFCAAQVIQNLIKNYAYFRQKLIIG